MYLYSQEEIERQQVNLMPMPYVSYVASPDFPGHNRLGYRGPEVEIPKPDGVFRIVALGGSTTYSSATPWEDAYPAQLQNILREEYGYNNVEVVNGGMPGYTSWDILANFVFRTRELEPDLVIIYEGINDVRARAFVPECYRGLNPLRGISPTRGVWKLVEVNSASVLYRLIAIHLGWMRDPSALTDQFDVPLQCPGDVINDAYIQENPPVYFQRHLRDLISLARASDVEIMFSTWTFNRNGDLGAIPPAWQAAVEEHNAIMRQLAAEFDVPLYDLAASDFWQNPAYWAGADPIHMAAPGTYEQARRYADYMVENHLLPLPSAS